MNRQMFFLCRISNFYNTLRWNLSVNVYCNVKDSDNDKLTQEPVTHWVTYSTTNPPIKQVLLRSFYPIPGLENRRQKKKMSKIIYLTSNLYRNSFGIIPTTLTSTSSMQTHINQ